MGLREYRAQIEREALAAACDVLKEPPYTGAKIIPFPARQSEVMETAPPTGDIQTQITDFLNEMGYLE